MCTGDEVLTAHFDRHTLQETEYDSDIALLRHDQSDPSCVFNVTIMIHTSIALYCHYQSKTGILLRC